MAQLRVALLQMSPCGSDQDANCAKGDSFCREAARQGADVALFPEMWNIGYSSYTPDMENDDFNPRDPRYDDARAVWQAQAIGTDSPFVRHFRALALELNIAIAITYLEKWAGAPRNTVSLIDRHGNIVLTYAKVHTCDFSTEEALTPGDDFYVAELDTAAGVVKIGAMICYDREFPESARVLMLKGAEVILVPNACDLEINRLSQLRARAYENMVAIAMTNYAGEGHSTAFDGIAFDNNGSRDMLVVEAGPNEGIYLAAFDLDQLRDYRRRESWGNAFRKPRAYAALVAPDVAEPFIRELARR
jgi:predicted amidohydrolase